MSTKDNACKITHWAAHPLTKNVLPAIPYDYGSVATKFPASTIPLRYLSSGELAVGLLTSGKGKVLFLGNTFVAEQLAQPLMDRILQELSGDRR